MRASAAWVVTTSICLLSACGEDSLAPVRAQLELNRPAVDFGPTDLGDQKRAWVVMRNVGRTGLHVQELRVAVPGVSLGDVSPVTLEPGQSTLLPVFFQPQQEGSVDGIVEIRSSLNESLPLGVRGIGVRPVGDSGGGDSPNIKVPALLPMGEEWVETCLVVSPAVLGFGVVPQGMSVTKTFEVRNRCSEDVNSGPFTLTATQGGTFVLGTDGTGTQPRVIRPGRSVRVGVTFVPKGGSRSSAGDITWDSRDARGRTDHLAVHLVGSSRAFAPCDFEVTPEVLDFGTVMPGTAPVLATVLHNRGSDVCYLSQWRMSPDSSPAFSALDVSARWVDPGRSLALQVGFSPSAEGTFQGVAQLQLNTANPAPLSIPIQARSARGCLVVEPAYLDFGKSRLSCHAKTAWVTARNQCTGAVEISAAQWGPSSSPTGELSVARGPALPQALVPGAEAQWQIRYQPTDEGVDVAALEITLGDGVRQVVGVAGFGLAQPLQTDRFVQDAAPKVDVLFVIDNSGSMMEEQQNLGQNFAAFLSSAQARGTDYQIGVTTTGIEPSRGSWTECPGGAQGGEGGRLFPVDGSTPRILTPTTPNAAQAFAKNVQVGWCHWNEEGLEAAYRALSEPLVNHTDDPRTSLPDDGNQGFLRPDARLALIFVTDEEDASASPVATYEHFFRGLKGNDLSRLSISAIVGPPMLQDCPTASSAGSRYTALAQANNGVTESICTPNWASALMNISWSAFGPRHHFPLSRTPGDPMSVTVKVDGTQVTTGWAYDAVGNSVRFQPGKAPPVHSVVEVSYALGCEP